MAVLYGFDVSSYQPDVHFSQAYQAGNRFVICKVSQGADYADAPWVDRKRRQYAKGAHLRVGTYHFAEMGSVSAELNWFKRCLDAGGGRKHGDLPCTIDFEWAKNGLSQAENYRWLDEFSRGVARHTGRGCILYGSPYYLDQHLWSLPPMCGVLWIAAYPRLVVPNCARRTRGAKVLFHQYSESGHVAGSPGSNDLDVFYGGNLALTAFCR